MKIEFPATATRVLLDAGGTKKSDGRTTRGRNFQMLKRIIHPKKVNKIIKAIQLSLIES